MPVYTYACTACGARLEVRQSFTDEALTVCPTCEGALRKTYDSISVTFNGPGFYRTDSRSAGPDAKPGDSSGPGGSEKSGGAAKSGESAKSGDSAKSDSAKAGESTKPAATKPATSGASTSGA